MNRVTLSYDNPKFKLNRAEEKDGKTEKISEKQPCGSKHNSNT